MYEWESYVREKYGEKAVESLIRSEKAFERANKDNDCKHCGLNSKAVVVDVGGGHPILMRYGSYTVSDKGHQCNYCGRIKK